MDRRWGRAPRLPRSTRELPTQTLGGVLWAEVDPGFHVCNGRGRFVGSVAVNPEGGYTAFGEASDVIGRFDELDAAKAAVLAAVGSLATTGPVPERRRAGIR